MKAPTILLLVFVTACGSSSNQKLGGVTVGNPGGGVHVGNPMDSTAVYQTHHSDHGFEFRYSSKEKLENLGRSEIRIEDEEKNWAQIRVLRPDQGPQSVEDFEAALRELEYSKEYDLIPFADGSPERIALRSTKVQTEEGIRIVEQRLILTPNKKLLLSTSNYLKRDSRRPELILRMASLRYDLMAPRIRKPEVSYDAENSRLFFVAFVENHRASLPIHVQMYIEALAPVSSLKFLSNVNFVASPGEEGKYSANLNLDLEGREFRVSQIVLSDALGNRRILMAPPFGRFYNTWLIPISESEASDFQPRLESSDFEIIRFSD